MVHQIWVTFLPSLPTQALLQSHSGPKSGRQLFFAHVTAALSNPSEDNVSCPPISLTPG